MDMEGTSRLKIFTGTAHPALAKEISDYIGVPLGKSLCGRFNNGEIQVMINESVRGKDCFIIQPTGSPVNDNLMEMLIMVDALTAMPARTGNPAAENRLARNWWRICSERPVLQEW